MKQKYLCLFLSILYIFSCSSDDAASYIALTIKTEPDNTQVYQDSFIEINILANDTNIPKSGTLSVSNSNYAQISILDNATPNNPSDDTITYTPNGTYIGTDTFTYSICATNGMCKTETVTVTVLPVSTVVYNPEALPYPNLSDYNFFDGDLKNLTPVSGVIPYDLNSTLFSDYAHKKRFIWMPNGSKATYNSDYTPFNFPVGTFLIKNFYYEHVLPGNQTQIIETRLMYLTETGWEFANYIWNDNQTEAAYTSQGSFVNIDWNEAGTAKNVNYRVPPRADCFTCHNKFGTPVPIGPKPQNINKLYNYPEGEKNQLEKWVEMGYLDSNYPQNIETTVNWENETETLELRARSYLDINCAHCHSEESYCEYRPMRFAFHETAISENLGICVSPDTNVGNDYPLIIYPSNPEASVAFFRISSIEEQYRMPILGRTLQHVEGVSLIYQWINSLTDRCE
ncbi:Ig-like domain-containing protein [Bizionia sp. KMM 8389]